MTVSEQSGAAFDFGRVTTRVGGLIQRNFLPFFALSFLFSGAPYLVLTLFQTSLFGEGETANAAAGLVLLVVSFLAGVVLQAALTRASIDDLSGKGVSIGASVNAGLGLILPLLGLGIVVSFGLMAGFILLIVPGIMLAVRWSVAPAVLVVEGAGILDAMGRSAKLTANHRWAIFGLVVLYVIFVWVLIIVVALATQGSVSAVIASQSSAMPVLIVVVTTLVQALQSMILTVGVAAVYFELRQIKEGVGITEIAAVFD